MNKKTFSSESLSQNRFFFVAMFVLPNKEFDSFCHWSPGLKQNVRDKQVTHVQHECTGRVHVVVF